MLKVSLTGKFRSAAGGVDLIELEAETICELMAKVIEQYPGMSQHLDEGIAVSINGQIYRDNWGVKIPQGSEVYLIPRIQGG